MNVEEDREQLIGQARAALEIRPIDLDEAARRFAARLDADAQRGAWRGSTEFVPLVRTWGRVLVLGAIGIALIALSMARCPLYERAIAPPAPAESEG